MKTALSVLLSIVIAACVVPPQGPTPQAPAPEDQTMTTPEATEYEEGEAAPTGDDGGGGGGGGTVDRVGGDGSGCAASAGRTPVQDCPFMQTCCNAGCHAIAYCNMPTGN